MHTMQRKKNKPLILALAASMALVMLFAATFAWFTAKDSVTNHFETLITDGTVSLFELFDPPTNWQPGTDITKEVAVVNNGDADVLVRVSFEEVLKLLKNGSAQTAQATAFDDTVTVEEGMDIPVNQPIASYTAAPWVEIINGALNSLNIETTTNPVPAGTRVFAQAKTDPVTLVTTYGFVIFGDASTYGYENLDGTISTKAYNQKMTADFSVDSSLELSISNIEYYVYEDGKEGAQYDWDSNNEKVPYATIAASPIDGPQLLADVEKALADSNIGLVYSAAFNDDGDVNNINPGEWWYNEYDGYFYYIGKLASGVTTANLLEKVSLASAAGDAYGLMEYDLIVLMEAIQNTTDAIESATGWDLDPTDTNYDDLRAVLKAYCN